MHAGYGLISFLKFTKKKGYSGYNLVNFNLIISKQ